MSRSRTSLLRRAGNEQGAAIIIVAISCFLLLAISAFAIDVGYILQAQRDLQGTSDAAALAGAQLLPDTAAAISTARAYSAISGSKNFRPAYPNVTMATGYPQTKCLTSTGISCGTTNANAIVVKQQEIVPMLFAGVLGFPNITISATSTTSMRGGVPHPLDVIVVLDTTGSMDTSCSSSVPGKSSPTRLDCAKAGVRALLSALWPCAQGLNPCGTVTNRNVPNPVDAVAMFVFPGLVTASPAYAPRDYDCTSNLSSSNIAQYSATSPAPLYLIVPLSSDYRTSDASGLNGRTSNIVQSVDWNDGRTDSCSSSASYGLENPGGAGSSFSEVITAAQTTLNSAGRANATHVIIFLSDGDANRGTNQCHAAITAAQNATSLGTWVYSIAYGASTSSGCSTDSVSITPYYTMQHIASDSRKFFNQPTSGDLVAAFQGVANDLTTTRVVDDATP